jgi:chitinase
VKTGLQGPLCPTARRRTAAPLLALGALAFFATAGLARAATASGAPGAFFTGPYQDVSLSFVPGSAGFSTPAWLPPAAPGRLLYWAFASGPCTDERWGLGAEAVDGVRFAAASVPAAVRAGQAYVISTGGEADTFTCDRPEDMVAFVRRYESPMLAGVDFDIERQQTPAQIRALADGAAALARRWPKLRISFTIATHAASDGSGRGLNATGLTTLSAVRAAGLADRAIINLMVMNYGPADPRVCVVRPSDGRCDMAASALQAARNLHVVHGVPYRQIALTLMLGENDVEGNVTRLSDAERVTREAREQGLAGVHHWAIDRDRACPAGSARVSPRCHALPGLAEGAFGAAIERAAGR